MRMQTVNGSSQEMAGCLEMLEMDVEGIKTWVHAYVVPDAPYRLLLGRPWQKLVHLSKSKDADNVRITITDPLNTSNTHTITTLPCPWPSLLQTLALTAAIFSSIPPPSSPMKTLPGRQAQQTSIMPSSHSNPLSIPSITSPSFAELLLQENFEVDPGCRVFLYKKVANKVKPVATTMPAHAHIIRHIPKDPLQSLPLLSQNPPTFHPGSHLSQNRMNKLGIFKKNFLWPEEHKLAAHVLSNNKLALAWDESEKGRFQEDYFPPIIIPTIEHTPWADQQPPIPPGICDEVIKLIKSKITSGVYEASNSSYQSKWFCVAKKNGSICIVHDLQKLNSVTVKDAATMPYVKLFVE